MQSKGLETLTIAPRSPHRWARPTCQGIFFRGSAGNRLGLDNQARQHSKSRSFEVQHAISRYGSSNAVSGPSEIRLSCSALAGVSYLGAAGACKSDTI
jgi:hypothetical protein